MDKSTFTERICNEMMIMRSLGKHPVEMVFYLVSGDIRMGHVETAGGKSSSRHTCG